ncbi:hypothetical protein CFBP6626_07585 [Agrobacterium tumefaciens]|nr:hypothetical protein CFBP6626_07585 [Agrobacterium tumefaciens]CUX07686.1 conserved hypothetical protein [Agrobacterium genomosp. 5 str. CFBP 6626]
MSSIATHTPGPWLEAGRGAGSHIHADKGEVAWLRSYMGIDDEQIEANARLIAAAPELLEALKWMVENDETNEGEEPRPEFGGDSWNEVNAFFLAGLNRARAAIAKAEGRS